MSCKYSKEDFSIYNDKDVSGESWKEFIDHLPECDECREEYERLLELDGKIENLFSEKEVPDNFTSNVMSRIPDNGKRPNKFLKGWGVRVAAFIAILLVGIVPLTIFISNNSSGGKLASIICIEDKVYHNSYLEVITDDKIIDEEIGTVNKSLKAGKIPKTNKWSSTFVKPGTKVYSIKNIDQSEAVAVMYDGKWVICREMSAPRPDYSMFTEDMLKAEKIVVEAVDEQGMKKEITDTEAIKRIALALEEAEPLIDSRYYNNSRVFTFYFLIRDSSGMGKISNQYRLNFQDVNFDGYIYAFGQYKVSSVINKLIAEPFGNTESNYDKELGGAQQINAIDVAGPKIIIRKLISEEVAEKSQVKLIGEGENIWENGTLTKDNLKGKYKIEVIMKNTKVREKVIEGMSRNYLNIPGAVSFRLTQGSDSNTTVIYIGFDSKIEYEFDEYGDSSLLLIR